MKKFFCGLLIAGLASCATAPGQNQYKWDEVGQSTLVEFGTIINVREVGITGRNSGAGALLGAGTGAGAGAYAGNGSGQIWTVAGGAIVGAIAGGAIEQAAANSTGMEYVITTEKGKTLTLTQNMNKGDAVLRPGQRVMVQTSGSYQRVLPADTLPTEVKRPKGIKVVD